MRALGLQYSSKQGLPSLKNSWRQRSRKEAGEAGERAMAADQAGDGGRPGAGGDLVRRHLDRRGIPSIAPRLHRAPDEEDRHALPSGAWF